MTFYYPRLICPYVLTDNIPALIPLWMNQVLYTKRRQISCSILIFSYSIEVRGKRKKMR